ncbi:MAG: tRNA (adenosine(37)-N6)-dimethylallyltransferase MiaA [Bacteroidia bacterium]|nr:tRNA (adenosine(37)-N6)-dimethylallyltransferase MiaA [Bacteroidia bacterium]
MKKIKTLLVIAGPTAIGKTSLAIYLAKHFDTEIISADSRQFYKEMSIGTAKPTENEMQGIIHHFIGHISIHQNYNAGKFETDVLNKLGDLFREKDIVIMCGGSGLFIDAVCNGFDEFDEIDPAIRKKLNAEFKEKGILWLQNQVKEKDPAYFNRADIHNPHRLLRALEVFIGTGKTFSSLKTGQKKERPFNIIKILLDTDRKIIYERINERTEIMMQQGWLQEANSLLPFRSLNALNTVGYKELFDHLEGKISFERCIELIKQNTRRYAKRQLTWFKKDEEYTSFEPGEEEKIKSFLEMVIPEL